MVVFSSTVSSITAATNNLKDINAPGASVTREAGGKESWKGYVLRSRQPDPARL